MTAKTTISVSTECYDEIASAMKAAGLEATPDQLTIKRDATITQPIDFRLATIRRDCLVEAVKIVSVPPNQVVAGTEIIAIAIQMYDFVIGIDKEPKPKTGGWDK